MDVFSAFGYIKYNDFNMIQKNMKLIVDKSDFRNNSKSNNSYQEN